MSKRTWIRLAIWIPLLAIALGYRWWHDQPNPPSRAADDAVAADEAFVQRSASAEEWAQPIETLGRERSAKRLAFQALGPDPLRAEGILVWWHDGVEERVSYLPAAGEDPGVGIALVLALMDGSAVLFDLHGDPGLVERLGELKPVAGLPEGWEILRPPPEPTTAP